MTFPIHKQYGACKVTNFATLDEIQATLIELIHEPTQAKIIYIQTDDDENLFNLSFQTEPPSSNGVAHILEHTVLCGSAKYPVKDPFFSMSRRSLNTFMNAFTGADFTCYPASSQVPQDFYNLLEVYLDAVFHPKLSRLSFLQEGHHFELVGSNLAIKGVVYNEMKGAMASADARLSEYLHAALLPDLTYRFNSGGNPKNIPELTHEELIAFHRNFYHPSRCIFYFYGNLPLEKHIAFLEEHAFKGVTPLAPQGLLAKQPRFKTPVNAQGVYPLTKQEESEDKTYVAFAWLTCSILEQEDLLALSVIDLVLMGTDAAPLKMALLKSNLCKQADSSLDEEMSEIPYFLVCKGCAKTSAPTIEKVIFETLLELARKGLPSHLVEGAIHQLEMSRTEISVPFGLALYFRSVLLKHHGGAPELGLKVHSLFKKLREKVEDPAYLTTLLRKYFIDNPHRVTLVMHPDQDLALREQKQEEELLQKLKATLTPEKMQTIKKEAKQLESYQEKQESLDVLPKVTLKDIAPQGKEFPLRSVKKNTFTCFYHPCFTNDILYVDLFFDLPQVAQEDLPYLRLFSLFLTQVGSGARDYRENLDYIFEHTGGLGAELELCIQVDDASKIKPALVLKGKALYRNTEKLFSILKDTIISADFNDEARLSELLMQHVDEVEHAIQNSPLRYATQLSTSSFSLPSAIKGSWYGLEYFRKIKEIQSDFEKHPLALIEKFYELQNLCLGIEDAHLVLGCNDACFKKIEGENFYALDEICKKPATAWDKPYLLPTVTSQARLISAPVAFTACAFKTISYLHPFSPILNIAAKIMENKTLHKRIREQGGAYGSGAANVAMAGHFYFYAYRDPHLAKTKEAFLEAAQEIAKGTFEDTDIEEAILEVIQDLDTPVAPGNKAMISYERLRSGRTPEKRQEYRTRLLHVTRAQLIQIAQEVLIPGLDKSIFVTFTGQELLEKENLNLPTFPVSP